MPTNIVNDLNALSDQYRQVRVETSTTLDLVVMAYSGILSNLNDALEAIQADSPSYDIFNDKVSNAQQIVDALDDGLDDSQGELPDLLSSLYYFIRKKLIESNMQKSPDGVKEVISIVEQVLSFWQESANNEAEPDVDVAKNEGLKIDISG
ncbi:MAG: flagellar export chaperone FliS [Planctomycetaceae bacterium]|nr:flagellar export chaperone FliS [Planctomycetaceae bacterium]